MKFFDLHCDTPYKCYKEDLSFDNQGLAVSSNGIFTFDKWYQCFAVWINEEVENPFSYYKNVLNNFKSQLNFDFDNLVPLYTVEGGTLLENNLERINELKNDGIRALTLTWNGENQIASGVNAVGGLKPFGNQVIKSLNDSKIATDLSHLNRESFFDSIEIAKYPIATHSCCDAIFSHKRNLSDEQIRLIAQKGGIIGVCLYPEFLGNGDVFFDVYKHIEHLLDMGLEKHISVGSDFDGADMDKRLSKITDIPSLYKKLNQFGIDYKTLNNIFFENAYNFFFYL